MTVRFTSFVVIAEMRTGSNFLQANLNALEGVQCEGEAFNRNFIGRPGADKYFGMTLNEREADPLLLLNRMRAEPGLTGFRFFSDHDRRILDAVLDDLSCAKIVLRRNPLESYVSLKIAEQTGQWVLTDERRQKNAKGIFDKNEFLRFLTERQKFQSELTQRFQESGQTAFYLRYEDLQSINVVNGIAKFLGVPDRLEKLDQKLKKQNPVSLTEKVSNASEMEEAISTIDWFDLDAVADLEPERMAAVTTYLTAARAPLVYLPIRGGPNDLILRWLANLDGVDTADLPTNLSQKQLRQWKRGAPGHRSFTVVRHPVARAHHVYCSYILGQGPTEYTAIRQNLARRTGGAIPHQKPSGDYDIAAHRKGFMAFVEFLNANLNGQTSIRVDAAWCTQAHAIKGFSSFAPPDLVLREDELAFDLPALAQKVGYETQVLSGTAPDAPFVLKDIYDTELETQVRKAYQRDYLVFGFADWA